MSKRERVACAVEDALKRAVADGAEFFRNQAKPTTIPKQGAIFMHDGDPGDPEITLSPLLYTYTHRFPLEACIFPADGVSKERALDDLMVALSVAIGADPTLQGLCEFVEFNAPSIDEVEQTGAVTGLWAEFAIVCTYSTSNPLN